MKASTTKAKLGERVQVAALPVKIDDAGNPQVLLLTRISQTTFAHRYLRLRFVF
jgi:hypothetical protein